MARTLLLLSLAGLCAAFAPARAPARGATITMAKFSLPKVALPTFEPAEPKGPIRGPNPNKGNYRVVGKAGYKIGDKVDAAFCFVPLGACARSEPHTPRVHRELIGRLARARAFSLAAEYDNSKPRVEFWQKIAERKAAVAAQKGSLPAKKFEAPKFEAPKFEAPKFEAPELPKFELPF